jgi:predicted nucleotidyltransferase
MTRHAPLELSAADQDLVLRILAAHLPQKAKAWVFGSRATGRARKYSDLDVAVDAGRALTLDELAALREAFSESDLAYRVDVVDWCAADERFRRTTAAERVPLNRAAAVEASGTAQDRL